MGPTCNSSAKQYCDLVEVFVSWFTLPTIADPVCLDCEFFGTRAVQVPSTRGSLNMPQIQILITGYEKHSTTVTDPVCQKNFHLLLTGNFSKHI